MTAERSLALHGFREMKSLSRLICETLLFVAVCLVASVGVIGPYFLGDDELAAQRREAAAQSLSALRNLTEADAHCMLLATIPPNALNELASIYDGALYQGDGFQLRLGKVSLTPDWGALEFDAEATLSVNDVECALLARGYLLPSYAPDLGAALRVQLVELKPDEAVAPDWLKAVINPNKIKLINASLPPITLPTERDACLPICGGLNKPVNIPTKGGSVRGILQFAGLPDLRRRLMIRAFVSTPKGLFVAVEARPRVESPIVAGEKPLLRPIRSEQFETVWRETTSRLKLPTFREDLPNRFQVMVGCDVLTSVVEEFNGLPKTKRTVRLEKGRVVGDAFGLSKWLAPYQIYVDNADQGKAWASASSISLELEQGHAKLRGTLSFAAGAQVYGRANLLGLEIDLSQTLTTAMVTTPVTLAIGCDHRNNDLSLRVLEPKDVPLPLHLSGVPDGLELQGWQFQPSITPPINMPFARWALHQLVPTKFSVPHAMGLFEIDNAPFIQTENLNTSLSRDGLTLSADLRVIRNKPAAN